MQTLKSDWASENKLGHFMSQFNVWNIFCFLFILTCYTETLFSTSMEMVSFFLKNLSSLKRQRAISVIATSPLEDNDGKKVTDHYIRDA